MESDSKIPRLTEKHLQHELSSSLSLLCALGPPLPPCNVSYLQTASVIFLRTTAFVSFFELLVLGQAQAYAADGAANAGACRKLRPQLAKWGEDP